jgi:hypothetical protein
VVALPRENAPVGRKPAYFGVEASEEETLRVLKILKTQNTQFKNNKLTLMSSCILSILGLVQPSPVNRLKSQLPGFPSLEDSFLIKLIMLRFQTSVLSRTVRITFAFGEAWKSSSQYMFPGMS